MFTLTEPKPVLICKNCGVNFVPETKSQMKCFNCIVALELREKHKKS